MSDQRTTDERYYQDEDGSWFMYAVDVESLVAPLRARVAVLEGNIEAVNRLLDDYAARGVFQGGVMHLRKALAGVGSTPNPSDEPSTSEERRLRYYLTNLRDGLTGGCLFDREWLVRYLDEVLNPVAGEGSDQDEPDLTTRYLDLLDSITPDPEGKARIAAVRGSHDVPARCEHGETRPHYAMAPNFWRALAGGNRHCPGPAAVVPTGDQQ